MNQSADNSNFIRDARVKKILNAILFITFLLGYMEWGGGKYMFIIQGEMMVLSKLFSKPMEVLHPFTIIPLIGQVLLLYTIFQKQPSRLLTLVALACMGLLMSLLFFIGLLSSNPLMVGCSLPFVITAVLVLRKNWKKLS